MIGDDDRRSECPKIGLRPLARAAPSAPLQSWLLTQPLNKKPSRGPRGRGTPLRAVVVAQRDVARRRLQEWALPVRARTLRNATRKLKFYHPRLRSPPQADTCRARIISFLS